jgi:hypothetical protein
MHGGTLGSGAPAGKRNGAYRFGHYTKDAIRRQRAASGLLAMMRETLKGLE